MILEAGLLLLAAQLAVAKPPTHDHTAGHVAADHAALAAVASEQLGGDRRSSDLSSALMTFPSIDEAARQKAWSVAPFATAAEQTSNPELMLSPSLTGPSASLAGFAPPAVAIVSEPLVSPPAISEIAIESPPPELMLISEPRQGRLRRWLGRQSSSDYGLAYDRVMFAPLVTQTALGVPNTGLSFRYNRGASRPDRLEYLWARAGKGPGAEADVDMLDSVFRTELGSARAVLISEISMRSLDPERAPNTTGFGDMVVGGKTLVMDGKCTKLSTIFLTYLNTGPADRGLGTGHVSLEPGLLGMHQWSDRTYLHGAINYRLPIAGARGFAGDVLTSSWAISTIWQDRDDFAWIPVLEFQTHSFLFGSQTEPNGSLRRVDGTTALDILPGSRFSLARTALGACELGVSGGFRCSDADWFDSRMMFDIRWLR